MLRVLLIEDDEILLNVMTHAFKKRHYDVLTAGDFVDAKRKVAEFNADSLPDIAVIDLKLKNQLSLPLIQQILDQASDCKILVLTGYASIATAVQAIKLGAKNYLPKPASIEDMLRALEVSDTASEISHREVNSTIVSPQRLEWEHIQRVLLEHEGNISAAARALNMHRRTLQRKLQKYPLKQ